MNLDGAFIFFGWLYIALAALLILWPWLRGTEDLLTAKNLFLAGTMNFFGVASITTGSQGYYIIPPSQGDFAKFLIGVALLLATFFVAYYWWKRPRKWAARSSSFVPDTGGFAILPIALVGAAMGVIGSSYLVQAQFLTQFLANIAVPVSTIAFAVVFWKWWNNKINGFYLTVALLFGAMMVMTAMSTGTSRRPLLGLFTAILLIIYWGELRSKGPGRVAMSLMIPLFCASVVISAYSVIRHQIRDPYSRSPFEVFLSRISNLTIALKESQATGSIIEGETTVSCTLACIDQFDTHGKPNYLHTFRFILANPFPRAWWPAEQWGPKPEALGESLPRDLGQWQRGYVNWGVGIIGHAYYDGGVWMVIVYGVILGGLFRYLDDRLRLQPENGFLIATVGALSPNILVISRGDLGVFGIEMVATLVCGWGMSKVAGFFFGYVELESHDEVDDEDGSYEHEDDAPIAPGDWGLKKAPEHAHE